jgi:hypothetical protein
MELTFAIVTVLAVLGANVATFVLAMCLRRVNRELLAASIADDRFARNQIAHNLTTPVPKPQKSVGRSLRSARDDTVGGVVVNEGGRPG